MNVDTPRQGTDPTFEDVLIEIFGSFVKPTADDVDRLIVDAQRRIVTHLGLDQSVLGQIDEATGKMTFTHAWTAPGFEPLRPGPADPQFPYTLERCRAGETVVLDRVEDLPPQAAVDLASMRSLGVKSAVTFPVAAQHTYLGVLGFGKLADEVKWHPQLFRRLRFVGEVIANLLLGRRTAERLNASLKEIRELKERLEAENILLQEDLFREHHFHEIVGQSPALMQVLHKVSQVAPTDSSVLLTGETGTGKDLIAHAIHSQSLRAERPLIRVNCAALPPQLVESELFGHEKGAFTGATRRNIGRFELADGSTLFLDEIGELPLELQPKLLRVLQSGDFERIGSSRTLRSDVRVISATNRDLRKVVEEGRFRADLYYRLGVFPIEVPPLRERREDIPLLTAFFLKRFRPRLGKRIERVSRATTERLMAHSWPGNVRELANVVERAMIRSPASTLIVDERFDTAAEPVAEQIASQVAEEPIRSLADVERDYIRSVCQRCGWKIRGRGGAAEILGLNPSTLRSRMIKLGVVRPRG